MEIEELREQLQKIDMTLARLEKELSRFKAIKQKSDKQLGKDILTMKENQAYLQQYSKIA